ncbi:MFS transporter [Adlercreutzia equolifaciens]|uniref:MFS transporter n=1 Tax=Adlercreutzia equolifaciens TaxID=446660 RepID=UPI003AF1C932
MRTSDIAPSGSAAAPALDADVPIAPAAGAASKGALGRVALSSFLGNFIEWFDYATYTYFAITIGAVFFPESGVNSTLMAFAVFALSFIFRPLGAVFWGNMGDKKGRKWSLSISIFLMSGAAFLIGCLPSFAAIGIASPVLLLVLRSVQGFSAAGEYSGAAVFLAEYAPADKRGRYCSLVPASTATGLFVGSTVALVLKSVLPEAALIEWGWRIPFLMAGPLGYIAHFIRTRLEDSPAFHEMEHEKKEADRPSRLVFKKYRRRLLSSIAATMVNSVGFYLVLTYLPTYLTSYTTMGASEAQLATDIALVTYIFIIFGAGRLSDRVGRRRMLLGACATFIVLSIPCFLMLGTASLPIVIVAELIMCVTLSLNDANIACYQAEMFPTEVRYTGAALGSNIAYVVFGGTASFVATALIDATGNGLMPAFYMMAISAVAGVILFFTAHDYNGIPLDEIR